MSIRPHREIGTSRDARKLGGEFGPIHCFGQTHNKVAGATNNWSILDSSFGIGQSYDNCSVVDALAKEFIYAPPFGQIRRIWRTPCLADTVMVVITACLTELRLKSSLHTNNAKSCSIFKFLKPEIESQIALIGEQGRERKYNPCSAVAGST